MEKLATFIRWTARIWSVPSVVALLLPYFVEGLYWLQATSIREVIGHVCFFAVLVGLILAWRWEGWGGGLTVGGISVFYITWWLHGKTPRGPFFLLIAAPGFLFLLYWLLTRRRKASLQQGNGQKHQANPDLEKVDSSRNTERSGGEPVPIRANSR